MGQAQRGACKRIRCSKLPCLATWLHEIWGVAGDSQADLEEFRLQNMDGLDLNELHRLAAASGKPSRASWRSRYEEYEPL